MKTAMYERAKVSELAFSQHDLSHALNSNSVSMMSTEEQKSWCSSSQSFC